jgi:agmatine/peptidylarginine deiminase
MKGDERAVGSLKDIHPGFAMEAVECRKVAEEGELLHCVTWQARLNESDAIID